MIQVLVGLVCGLAVGAAYRWRQNIKLWVARRRAAKQPPVEVVREEEP